MSAPPFWTAAKAERISAAARSLAQERQPRALTNKKQKVLIENDFNMQRYYDYFLEMDLRLLQVKKFLTFLIFVCFCSLVGRRSQSFVDFWRLSDNCHIQLDQLCELLSENELRVSLVALADVTCRLAIGNSRI